MSTTQIRITRLFARAMRGTVFLLLASLCPVIHGEGPTASELLTSMMDNLNYPPGVAMDLKVESQVTWNNAPAAEVAPYSGTLVDEWRALSSSERFGRELRRESPAGRSQSRIVYQRDKRWTFEFDTGAPPDAAIAGRVVIRDYSFRGPPRWRVPLVEYFDRVFILSGRFFYENHSLQVGAGMEPIDNHPCHVVQGEWNGRAFTFWLDPEYGYLPRKYTMRLLHANEETSGFRGGPGPAEGRVTAPPEMQGLLEAPIESEETLSSVVLDRSMGRSYIAAAILEKNRTYANGVSHSEHLTFHSTGFGQEMESEVEAFLNFSGLLRDGTPATEEVGGRSGPTSAKQYVFKKGKLVPAWEGSGAYFTKLGQDLKRLVRDFSIDNVRRLDSAFLVVVCAGAALLINGVIAYLSYRKKRAKSQEAE